MQPFSAAKLQAKIIEHDENCMYEVLEECSWGFEKVRPSVWDHEEAAEPLCAKFLFITFLCGLGSCQMPCFWWCSFFFQVSCPSLTCILQLTEGSAPLDPTPQSL